MQFQLTDWEAFFAAQTEGDVCLHALLLSSPRYHLLLCPHLSLLDKPMTTPILCLLSQFFGPFPSYLRQHPLDTRSPYTANLIHTTLPLNLQCAPLFTYLLILTFLTHGTAVWDLQRSLRGPPDLQVRTHLLQSLCSRVHQHSGR